LGHGGPRPRASQNLTLRLGPDSRAAQLRGILTIRLDRNLGLATQSYAENVDPRNVVVQIRTGRPRSNRLDPLDEFVRTHHRVVLDAPPFRIYSGQAPDKTDPIGQ
jgi:hypothetical protein